VEDESLIAVTLAMTRQAAHQSTRLYNEMMFCDVIPGDVVVVWLAKIGSDHCSDGKSPQHTATPSSQITQHAVVIAIFHS
jgi:hypothetical protein